MNNKIKIQEVIKKALLSVVISILPVCFLLIVFITNNNDTSGPTISHRFLFLLISFTIPLFLLQVFIPWFSKRLILGVLLGFVLIFIFHIINVSYAQYVCNQINGDWKVEFDYFKSGGLNPYTRRSICYVSNNVYRGISTSHSFLFSNFTYFQVK